MNDKLSAKEIIAKRIADRRKLAFQPHVMAALWRGTATRKKRKDGA